MVFNLTEEQSYDVLSHFVNYQPLIQAIKSEAYDIMQRYYDLYSSNKNNWIFKKLSQERFFEKIGQNSTEYCVRIVHEFKDVYSFNSAKLNIKLLNKYGIIVEPIAHNIIDEAINCPYIFGTDVTKIKELHNMLVQYATIPFSVDENVITKYHDVKKENNKRIELLSTLGVKYDL